MKMLTIGAALLLLFAAQPARAASVTGSLVVTVAPAVTPLAMAVSPSTPTVACAIPAGTVVAMISVGGGDGNAVTLTLSGGDSSIVLSGTTPPANAIVGPGGILPADCGTTIPAFTITASQP